MHPHPPSADITTLFLDIGGVLLTNGWDRHIRPRAADHFALDPVDFENRHKLSFDSLERGHCTLDTYLDRTVFHTPRPFTREAFVAFMFEQSQPLPGVIDFFSELKERNGLRVVAVSNENRALNDHRIRHFGLRHLVDCFVSSCYTGFRKPDPDLFRLALDLCQTPAAQVAFVDNTPLFVDIAETLGMHGVRHTSLETTRCRLSDLGLSLTSETRNAT